jgi:hypothetical protein
MGGATVIFVIIMIVVVIFVLRLFGAWMLRIDEVIDLLRAILKELRSPKNSIDGKAQAYDAIEEAKRKLQKGI